MIPVVSPQHHHHSKALVCYGGPLNETIPTAGLPQQQRLHQKIDTGASGTQLKNLRKRKVTVTLWDIYRV